MKKTMIVYFALIASFLVLGSCSKGNQAKSEWVTLIETPYWKMTPEELGEFICSHNWIAYEEQKDETVYVGKIDHHPEAMSYTVSEETGLVNSVTFLSMAFSEDAEEAIKRSLSELDEHTYDPLLASFIMDKKTSNYVSSSFFKVRQAFEACGAVLPENQAGFRSDRADGIQKVIAPYEEGTAKVTFAEGYYRFPDGSSGVSYGTIITTDGTALPREKILFQVFLCSDDYTDHFGGKPQDSGYQISKDTPIVVGSVP